MESKNNIDDILTLLTNEESNNYNLIITGKEQYFLNNNNILAFIFNFRTVFDKNNEIEISFDFKVIDLINTLKIFSYFEANIDMTHLIYRQNKHKVVQKLVIEIVNYIRAWKFKDTLDFIHLIHFLNTIMHSDENFKKNISTISDLLNVKFDNLFMTTFKNVNNQVKISILFHNFISLFIISMKKFDSPIDLDYIQIFLNEQSISLLNIFLSKQLDDSFIMNYIISLINILENITAWHTLKCFNLLCIRCFDCEINENFLCYEEKNIFMCNKCFLMNLYESQIISNYNIKIYLEFIVQKFDIRNFIELILNKIIKNDNKFLIYEKLSKIIKELRLYLDFYSTNEELLTDARNLYEELFKEIESFAHFYSDTQRRKSYELLKLCFDTKINHNISLYRDFN